MRAVVLLLASLLAAGGAFGGNFTTRPGEAGDVDSALRPGQSAFLQATGNAATLVDLDRSGLDESCPAAVTCVESTAHGYKVGDYVTFSSDVGGMTQIRGLIGKVTIVVDANNFRVNIDSSGFTAWTSAGSVSLRVWACVELAPCDRYAVVWISDLEDAADDDASGYPWRCTAFGSVLEQPPTDLLCDPIDFGATTMTGTDVVFYSDFSPPVFCFDMGLSDAQRSRAQVDCR